MTRTIGAVLIAGPTASGKSALALALASRLDGAVVNADSMQVYSDLRVVTARPGAAEEALAPHLLYGHVDGATTYSVGRYLGDAARVIESLTAERRLAIVVGGTGLYFKALIEGLSRIPPVPPEIREAVRQNAKGRDTGLLHAELAAHDPAAAATLRPSDRLRVLRALEVNAATGRSLTTFHGNKEPGPLADRRTVRLFLARDRAELNARIDVRFRAMIDAGALDEIRALAMRRLDPALPVMRAHGVPWLLKHLAGAITLDEAIAEAQADTRRYAKRQFTWFRHQMPGWTWTTPQHAEAAVLAAVKADQ